MGWCFGLDEVSLKTFQKEIENNYGSVFDHPDVQAWIETNGVIVAEHKDKNPTIPRLEEREGEQVEWTDGEDEEVVRKKKRRPFTDEETDNVLEGYRKYGARWKTILENYKFDNRTAVDLKDKIRNLKRSMDI